MPKLCRIRARELLNITYTERRKELEEAMPNPCETRSKRTILLCVGWQLHAASFASPLPFATLFISHLFALENTSQKSAERHLRNA